MQQWEPTEECGRRFKAAIDDLLQWALAELQRAAGGDGEDQGLTWFMEFQQRGAPHLHFFASGRIPKAALAQRWAAIAARHGFGDRADLERAGTRIEALRAGHDGAISYALKYATKQEQKEAPEGYWSGRWWGVRGNRKRGSCHVAVEAYSAGVKALMDLRRILKAAVDRGEVREIRWQHGVGAVYVPRHGRTWPGKLAGEIEIQLIRSIRDGGLVMVDDDG